jgi:hypothetical protein
VRDADLSLPFDDIRVALLDFSDSSGVGFADLLGVFEASGVGFDEAFPESVCFTVLLEAAFDGFAGVTVGFGFGVGFSVSGAFEDLGFGDALGFLLGFGALLFGFFDLLFGGAGSAFSPDFALFSPKEKHLETRSHSRSWSWC